MPYETLKLTVGVNTSDEKNQVMTSPHHLNITSQIAKIYLTMTS